MHIRGWLTSTHCWTSCRKHGLLGTPSGTLPRSSEILCMSLSRHRSSSASSTRSMHLRQFQEPRKILTHHAIQTEFLQLLGVDKASCLQILCTECVALRPLASGSPQPKWPRPTSSKSPLPDQNGSELLVCVAPSRTMHLWRISDDGHPLPTFAFGDRARGSKSR